MLKDPVHLRHVEWQGWHWSELSRYSDSKHFRRQFPLTVSYPYLHIIQSEFAGPLHPWQETSHAEHIPGVPLA